MLKLVNKYTAKKKLNDQFEITLDLSGKQIMLNSYTDIDWVIC